MVVVPLTTIAQQFKAECDRLGISALLFGQKKQSRGKEGKFKSFEPRRDIFFFLKIFSKSSFQNLFKGETSSFQDLLFEIFSKERHLLFKIFTDVEI